MVCTRQLAGAVRRWREWPPYTAASATPRPLVPAVVPGTTGALRTPAASRDGSRCPTNRSPLTRSFNAHRAGRPARGCTRGALCEPTAAMTRCASRAPADPLRTGAGTLVHQLCSRPPNRARRCAPLPSGRGREGRAGRDSCAHCLTLRRHAWERQVLAGERRRGGCWEAPALTASPCAYSAPGGQQWSCADVAVACVVEDVVLVAPWCKSCVPTPLAALHARVAALPCAAGLLDDTLFSAAGGGVAATTKGSGRSREVARW